MSKFFVEENQINLDTNQIIILGEDVNHIKNVLRLTYNDKIKISTKTNTPICYLVKIISFENEIVKCDIIEQIEDSTEPKINLTIVQGIPKFEKMEWIIQKGTELGVSKFIPLELKRCVVKLKQSDEEKKITRWQKIAEVASKQSGRDKIPEIMKKENLKQFCNRIADYDCVLVAYEQEKNNSLKTIFNKKTHFTNIAIVIGPEGGFDTDEINELEKTGAKIISLGNRILRTETAPIVLSSIIMYELNEFERN